MLKYTDANIVFREIPGEVSLAIDISGCPNRCPGCHSKWLQEDIGVELDSFELRRLLNRNQGITCVCFMGGDNSIEDLKELIGAAIRGNKMLKIAWYSGSPFTEDTDLLNMLDYYKCGPYDSTKGPLSSLTTNQKFYKITHRTNHTTKIEDKTVWFTHPNIHNIKEAIKE